MWPLLLVACLSGDPPAWTELPVVVLDPEGEPTVLDLSQYVEGGAGRLEYSASGDGQVLAETLGPDMLLAADPVFRGTAVVELLVTDQARQADATELLVTVGAAACPVTLSHTALGEPAAVTLDGELVQAAGGARDFTLTEDGTWQLDLDLAPGAYPYRIVETVEFSQAAEERSYCDAQAAEIHCPAGYKDPWDVDWGHDCTQPDSVCDSLLVVDDCSVPQLELVEVDIDRVTGSVSAQVAATPAITGAGLLEPAVELDGIAVSVAWDGATFHVEHTGLSPGRHTLRATLSDEAGGVSEELWIPFWTDVEAPRDGFRDGSIYYAFVDRLANGDSANDGLQGATGTIADFAGGDWAGVREMLPYLDELGVRTLWLSNPQDNPDGAWDGQCDATFAGYHAYWPTAALETEEHFGTAEELHTLVEDAHALGMRVVMDWVANHLHQDHPYVAELGEESFNTQAMCTDADNWNTIPEACWFAYYLPDLDYTRPEVMDLMLDDALWWARTFDLDGFRVDAAKHMPHSVQWNLEARVQAEIEHTAAGGDEEFWTVGETFDGAERIAAYVGEEQLDGQFDFPLYYAIRNALGTRTSSPADLSAVIADSTSRYQGALMSNFLGNHDVTRFVTEVAWGGGDVCSGDPIAQASMPWESTWTYERMVVAWAFVLTRPEVPLIYYGDEIGMPGYADPDNRQPLWWYYGWIPDSVAEAQAGLSGTIGFQPMADILDAVAALGQARRSHRSLWKGTEVEWWVDEDVLAWARTDSDDASLVVLNPSDVDRELVNGATFAGLPSSGSMTEVLTGEELEWSDDSLTVQVPARSARVYVTD